ncbi:fatty acid desaturase [Nocardia sp. NPDC058705]|uniref:fatty acid desaturase n=1 Tax=Nocardia sp. NPDC058705 TaxID=3346609 RepID=UPI0036B791DE
MTIDEPKAVFGRSVVMSDNPRDSMLRLPGFAQLPLTLFTGKPYAGQPDIRLGASFHTVGSCLSMLFGVAVTTAALSLAGFWTVLCVIGVAMTLHGMRNARMMVFHQAAHKNLYRRERLDKTIGQVCSAILLVQNFSQYSKEHTGEHHSRHHMTLRDPTVQAFLIGLGLGPGMSRAVMWRKVLAKLISPAFHLSFAIGRIRSFWAGSTRAERSIAIGFYVGAAAVATATGTWLVLLVGWAVPLFPLFQISNTLRLCVKHTFPEPGQENVTGKIRMASLTNAIFIGEAVPDRGIAVGHRIVAWLRWMFRMAFVHAPARYLVLTGDTVCHDFHHRYPRHKLWFDFISERQADQEAARPDWPPYSEVWGLTQAIGHVFDTLGRANPEFYDRAKIGSVSSRAIFAAFDD